MLDLFSVVTNLTVQLKQFCTLAEARYVHHVMGVVTWWLRSLGGCGHLVGWSLGGLSHV